MPSLEQNRVSLLRAPHRAWDRADAVVCANNGTRNARDRVSAVFRVARWSRVNLSPPMRRLLTSAVIVVHLPQYVEGYREVLALTSFPYADNRPLTTNFFSLTAVPFAVVTVIGPVVAPEGTMIWTEELPLIVEVMPSNNTRIASGLLKVEFRRLPASAIWLPTSDHLGRLLPARLSGFDPLQPRVR